MVALTTTVAAEWAVVAAVAVAKQAVVRTAVVEENFAVHNSAVVFDWLADNNPVAV